jgi:predicted permease
VRVFGFALILSLATGIVFGLLPALQATRLDLNSVLKQEGRSASRQSRGWLRSMLLATQVAVCLVLLVAAGLILRAVAVAQIRDPGFNTRNVVAASRELEQAGYNEVRAARFYQLLTDRLREQPGVKAIALASVLPLSGGRMGDGGVVDGHEFQLTFNTVSPEFFDVLDMPIVSGRRFLKSENTGREPVAIVSESTARRFWPGADPIGKQIRMGEPKVAREVVGVAKDVYITDLSTIDGIFVYVPASPARLGMRILARGHDAVALTRQVQEIAAGIDRNVFVQTIELQENLKRWQSPMRILVALSSALGLLALLLAATGIFGVLNYAVSQRTHEIGTRMALGADANGILRMIIGQSLRPVFLGALLGLAVAAAVSRILTSVLFGVSPLDPIAFLGMLLLLFVVACTASFLPAHRAARTDPAAALRHE